MSKTIFLRLLSQDEKGLAIAETTSALHQGKHNQLIFIVDTASFAQVPGTPFAYWVSEKIRRLFKEVPPFESEGRVVRAGLQTSDDNRFVRAWWEVSAETLVKGTSQMSPEEFRQQTYSGKRWVTFAKGGANSSYFTDMQMVVNWENDGEEMKDWAVNNAGDPRTTHWSRNIRSTEYYFRPGLSWPLRTYRFSPYIVPQGCIFSLSRYQAFADEDDLGWCLGLLNGAPVNSLLRMCLEDFERPKYVVGVVSILPFPFPSINDRDKLASKALQSFKIVRQLWSASENSHSFNIPALCQIPGTTLETRASTWQKYLNDAEQEIKKYQTEIDSIAFASYGIEEDDRLALEMSLPSREDRSETSTEKSDVQEEVEETELLITGLRELTVDLLSYAVGCAFGRWDIRIGCDRSLAPPLAEPFAPLPVCAPGALVGPDGLFARPGHIVSKAWLRGRPDAITLPPEGSVANPSIPDEVYPLSIAWDGILVDNPNHSQDVIRQVDNVFRVIWQEKAEAIEQETCQILGVKELREYFRRSGNDGFWMSHVKRYSKSRRKAPIYWLLQSTKRNYAFWLYYHRLDKDILFKALTIYVEPKIRLEEGKLEQLRTQLAGAGIGGKEVKQLEKQLDHQENLLAELYDFKDKLRRVADLNLEPDLNDGVVLNIAPLWELVPWGEAKKYWEELLAGKYEWSSISKQLRNRGVI